MRKAMIVLGVVLFLLGIIAGCEKKRNNEEKTKEVGKQQTVIGKWGKIHDTGVVEFFKDGTVTITDDDEDRVVGNYRLLDDNRIRIDLGGFIGSDIAEISYSRNEITLPALNGKVEKYRKYTIINFSGRWEVEDDRIKFYEGDKEVNTGQITEDSIILQGNWLFIKQKEAVLIKTWKTMIVIGKSSDVDSVTPICAGVLLAQVWEPKKPSTVTGEAISHRGQKKITLTINLWSNYKAISGSTLKIKKNGTFLINMIRG